MTANSLDTRLVRSACNRAASSYEASAALQQEVEQRLLERLLMMRVTPEWVVDLGCGTGRGVAALRESYPSARVLGVDFAIAMLRQAANVPQGTPAPGWICGDISRLPLKNRGADLLFSNLALPLCNDFNSLFAEFNRILKPGGLLLFSCLGPDTLGELRTAWAAADNQPHVNVFPDMHDIGDALVKAGFAEPVMEVEHITLTYGSVRQLMRELKATGAQNASRARARGLTGRSRLETMLEAYEPFRNDGRYPATCEIIYGVAWGPAEGRAVQTEDGDIATFSVDHLRRSRAPTE